MEYFSQQFAVCKPQGRHRPCVADVSSATTDLLSVVTTRGSVSKITEGLQGFTNSRLKTTRLRIYRHITVLWQPLHREVKGGISWAEGSSEAVKSYPSWAGPGWLYSDGPKAQHNVDSKATLHMVASCTPSPPTKWKWNKYKRNIFRTEAEIYFSSKNILIFTE